MNAQNEDYSPNLENRLAPVMELLHKQEVLESMTQRQHQPKADVIENLMLRQHTAALNRELSKLDSADIAHLLTMLPAEERPLVWLELSTDIAGEVLIEVPDSVAQHLIQLTPSDHLIDLLQTLDADELSLIADLLPEKELNDAKALMASHERRWLEESLSYPEDSVGEIMSKDSLIVPQNYSINQAIELVRSTQELPPQADKLFVVNQKQQLVGVIPLISLMRNQANALIMDCMATNTVSFNPEEEAEDAGQAFERYDLISAPVVDGKKHVIGRLTVESIMDHLRDRAEAQALAKEGLSADTDLLGPVLISARQRWPWLCVNLITAFLATRFISVFENTIAELVILAALMPIVASVGGNTGNQTAALLIRGLAMNQITRDNVLFIYRKELLISLLNGLLWGSLLGLVTLLIYHQPLLAFVMGLSITMNLLLAAVIGISVPLVLDFFKKDPAMGSSVILTFVTDSMGFFIFLGLASIILI